MKNSAERIQFITNYIFSYENMIKELNKQGLFDAAKMFELFASKVGELYLGLSKPFINLNTETSTFPCVDLFSEDGNIFCQVSTCKDIPAKIKTTLNSISNSKNDIIKTIQEVYFIVLNNENIEKVNDLTIENVSFNKSKNLITTSDIITKTRNDLEFQKSLYAFLKKYDDLSENDFEKFQESINYDSKVILEDIDEHINKSYYIDLASQITEINLKKCKFNLISGEAGSGKSVLCKKILENKKNVLCARAEKLVEVGDVNKIWNFNFKDTLNLVKDEVYVYIDALEFIADNRNKLDVLDSMLKRINELDNIYFLCSCRSNDLNSFIKIISKYNIVEYKIKPIDKETLIEISEKIPILTKIIKNRKYDPLLVNPFYINFMTKLDGFDSLIDENQLREKIWKEIICLNDEMVGKIVTEIVLDRATKFILYSDASNYDKNTINNLISNNVLIKNENGIRLKYDIFEDICFEQYIDNLFDDSKGDYSSFFKNLKDIGRCIYRRYQIWIENKLFSKTNRERFLYKLVTTDSILNGWKQQTIIGIIKSNYCKDFFEDYNLKILDNGLLIKFIDITNIYGFEINKILINRGIFSVKNKGYGREALIKIIYESKFYKFSPENENSIKKLIFDYTCSITSENISTYSFEILKYFIDMSLKNNFSYDLIKNEVESMYKLHKVSDHWIKNFFAQIKTYIFSDEEDKFDFANEAIKNILFVNCPYLVKNYSDFIREFYDIYYTIIKKDKNSCFNHYYDEWKKVLLFGLNENADNYNYKNFDKKNLLFNPISLLLNGNFWPTFEWYLDFVNKCIQTFKTKSEINSYRIYFSKDCIKEYYGTSEMWWTGECQNNIPTLLSDMTFIVKSVIIESIKKCDLTDKTTFANKIKKMIYEKSNNIIGLSIISNVGLTFPKELHGYCLELVSSLEIVYDDLTRYGSTSNNLIRKNLEKEIAKNVGLPYLFVNEYNCINTNNNLREYTFLTQLKYPTLQTKYFEIFDYLYSFVKNDKEHAHLHLFLQQMDIRNASAYEVDSNTFEIISNVDGAAKDISDGANEKSKLISAICEKINKITDSLKNKTITIEEIDNFIKETLEYENSLLFSRIHNAYIYCISFALTNLVLDAKKRNEYCLFWIKYADLQLKNLPIFIDTYLYQFLFNQLNEEIDVETKNKIKYIILEVLLNGNNNDGTKYQLFNVTKKFLESNKKYGKLYLNTVFLIAEDEMNHQIHNYNFMCKYHNYKKEDFIPYKSYRLREFDVYIEQKGEKQYESKRNEIIKKYLYEEQDYDYSKTDISHFDIRIICHAFSCGLDLNDPSDRNLISCYFKQLIEICNDKFCSIFDAVGYYELLEVEEYFKKCLLDLNLYSYVLKILFEKVDFQQFTRETIDLYLNILASMTTYYFDSYVDREQRNHVENVIRSMERYINNISVEWVKNDLSKALFLGFSRFTRVIDRSKCITSYNYLDKAFLNDIFSKYGYLHFNDLLIVINYLQYKKLLPEILISIYSSFKKYINLYGNRTNKKMISPINKIMYYAFVNYENEIKNDNDLINAFEGILLLLIELKDETSAVLLDEFRVH